MTEQLPEWVRVRGVFMAGGREFRQTKLYFVSETQAGDAYISAAELQSLRDDGRISEEHAA